jgi:hypothetical protein
MAVVYTHNGGPNPPHVFTVDVASGVTVGTFNMTEPGPNVVKEPRSIRLDWTNGDLYLADIGDPTQSRTDICLWKTAEPGPGDWETLASTRYPIEYPFGPTDAEALAIHPLTGVKYIITKETVGKLVRLPMPLTGANMGVDMGKPMPANVTDATFTIDGKWLLVRAQDVKDTLVYNGNTFAYAGAISTVKISGGSSITVEPDGKNFLIGAGGQFSQIYRIPFPTQFTNNPTPTPDPTTTDPTPGVLTTLKDGRIEEASGMSYSTRHYRVVVVHNDEGENPQVYGVNILTGQTVYTYGISGSALKDPEAIRIHPLTSVVWLADIGDNDGDRDDCSLVLTTEPASLGNKGVLSSTRLPISYPQGPQNAESLLIHPVNGAVYIITKASVGRLYRLATPVSTTNNMLVHMNKAMPANVTDATFTKDGRFVFIRCEGVQNTLVYSASTWTQVGSIASPALSKGESITVEPEGRSFLIGSEGLGSPIVRVLIPNKWRAAEDVSGGDSGGGGGGGGGDTPTPPACNAATTRPKDIINLTNWKLDLPDRDTTTIFSPQLRAGYENNQYFFTACPGPAVVFRAPVGGSTTANSENPRSELREMRSNGTDEAGWNMKSGTHTMTIVQAITSRPRRDDGKNPVVAGQIHDEPDDVTVARLEGPHLVATRDDKVSGSGTFILIPNYKLGTYFTLKMVANASGTTYYINGVRKGTIAMVRDGKGNYFKAGAYTQAHSGNGGVPGTYGEVRIKSLIVTHT